MTTMVDAGGKVYEFGLRDRLRVARESTGLTQKEFAAITGGGQGGHLAPQRVGDLVSAALPGDWTAHSLRHRAGTRWFHLDHDLLTVRDLLGHSSVATTQGYVAVEHDDARRTVTAGAVS